MRFPGGAVCPPMKLTTGFFTFPLMKAAPSSSIVPPISPIITIACVSGSSLKSLSTSTNSVPCTGSPPIPTHVDCPSPTFVSCHTDSYVSVPERDTTPTFPGMWM